MWMSAPVAGYDMFGRRKTLPYYRNVWSPKMTEEELLEKLEFVQEMKCETRTLELKSAATSCPKRLYDTLSSFSNQDDGGVIIFGVSEEEGYKEVGVYDPHDIQKKINEQCLQMEPKVRPLLTVVMKDGKTFVSAEIPGIDLAERPCHYQGKGRLRSSYIRVGDSDEPMTEYEIYSYEAYRKKYQDDIRVVNRVSFSALNRDLLESYVKELKSGRPNLSQIQDDDIYELMSIRRDGEITLSAALIFSPYPQAYFPQLCITAVVVPGVEMGDTGESGERFVDNQRIEGNISDLLDGAIRFVKKNMGVKTVIDPDTGRREDQPEYPITAVREAVLNALVHRDYSIHTEGQFIQLLMFSNRMEIRNPGGLYGRIRVDQLGKVQPDTRNPVLTSILESLHITENRYSGIPTIRREMARADLPEPEFIDDRGSFLVTLYKGGRPPENKAQFDEFENSLIVFCKTPRTRREICDFLGLSSVTYVIKRHVTPLVKRGLIKLSIPEKPTSPKQLYYSE